MDLKGGAPCQVTPVIASTARTNGGALVARRSRPRIHERLHEVFVDLSRGKDASRQASQHRDQLLRRVSKTSAESVEITE